LVGVSAIINKIYGVGLIEETRVTIGRDLGSILGDPNDLALVLMFPAAFAMSLITTKQISRWQRWLGIVSASILFFAIIATQSRGGLLGIMAVFGVFAYRKLNNRLLFIALGAVAAIALYTIAGISDRSSGGAVEQGMGASAQGRLYAWEAAGGMARHNPLTGVGIDNFYANFFFYSPHWDGLNHAVHSTWFGVLAETGFLGLIVFITMIIMLLRLAHRSIEQLSKFTQPPAAIVATATAVYAGLIGTIVAGTFLTQGFTWPIYILAALVLALARWVKVQNQ
ncbi:MAG: O-antigen ligase family protein, partial [Gammaproteobacteria bacterium]|nr:O-antigen ligase family protein [Gammaproteobacteria bacterium]